MASPAPRSAFVTALAWTFLVLSGLGSVIGVLQNLMVHTLMLPMMRRDPLHGEAMAQLPGPAALMFDAMPWFFLVTLAVSLLGVVASLGLLKRRAWGRRLFIALMGVLIAWQVAGFAFQVVLQRDMQSTFAASGIPPESSLVFVVMQVFIGLFAAAFIALFGWIIHRLNRPAIVAEFAP
jgi:hypothetical protein